MRITFNSPVILTFSLICVAVYFLDKAVAGGLMQFFTLTRVSTADPLSLVTLVSHVAGHVNLEHLLGNLTFVLLLGPIIEEKYGSGRLLIMILVTALVTGLLNIFLFHT